LFSAFILSIDQNEGNVLIFGSIDVRLVAVVNRLVQLTTWHRRSLVFGRIKAGPTTRDVISGALALFCKKLTDFYSVTYGHWF